jgi:hypothetical protein
MAKVQILYWRDIPSVIQAFDDDGTPLKRQLPDWYQQEIDRVAMAEGLIESGAYLDQWRWGDVEERPGDPSEVLDAVERELEAARAG